MWISLILVFAMSPNFRDRRCDPVHNYWAVIGAQGRNDDHTSWAFGISRNSKSGESQVHYCREAFVRNQGYIRRVLIPRKVVNEESEVNSSTKRKVQFSIL